MYFRKLHVCCPKLDVQETNFCSTESEIISRLNPAKDGGADRVFSSFVVCGGVCLQGFCSRTWSSNIDQITEVRARYFSKSIFLQRTRDQLVDLVETQMMDHVEIKKCPRSQARTVSRQSKLSCRSEFLRGCVIRSGLLKCTRSHAKKVSRQSTIAFQERISESMCGQSCRGAQDLQPGKCRGSQNFHS